MRRFAAIVMVALGCGTSSGRPEVIAEVGADDGAERLREMIARDERRAAEIVRNALAEEGSDRPVWAAVYALRLGLRHDDRVAKAAVRRGASDPDPFLASLCWRWLAALSDVDLPPDPPKSADALVRTMAALAHAGRGDIPAGLSDALGLPAGDPTAPSRQPVPPGRANTLVALSAPFDDGPLAIGLAFLEARRNLWVEEGSEGRPIWAATRFRHELTLSVSGGSPRMFEAVSASRPVDDPPRSGVADRIDSPLARRPAAVLRGPSMTGSSSLRIEALRALAVAARQPEAGDLGAAAASLDAASPDVRLEAARTFLLLAKRAHAAR